MAENLASFLGRASIPVVCCRTFQTPCVIDVIVSPEDNDDATYMAYVGTLPVAKIIGLHDGTFVICLAAGDDQIRTSLDEAVTYLADRMTT